MLKKEVAVQLFEHLLDNREHGYSMDVNKRWGEEDKEACAVTINKSTYYLKTGDRDCSSSIICAYREAGIDCGDASVTQNMISEMERVGSFRWHPWGDGYVEKRGDIYLNVENHAAMCLSEGRGKVGEFSQDVDGMTGTQYEGEKGARFFNENEVWDGILECICTEQDESIVKCATLQDMDYSANQRWKLEPVSGNSFRLKNVGTNLYLDVSNSHTGSWAELIAFIPTGGANQVFEFVPCFYGLIKAYLLKAFSGMVLENTFEVGERVFTTMPESREIKQQWVLLNVDNGECVIINQRSGLVLGVL